MCSYVGHPLFENTHLLSSVKKYEDRDTDLGIFQVVESLRSKIIFTLCLIAYRKIKMKK